jgi:hypothetical protein
VPQYAYAKKFLSSHLHLLEHATCIQNIKIQIYDQRIWASYPEKEGTYISHTNKFSSGHIKQLMLYASYRYINNFLSTFSLMLSEFTNRDITI